MESRRARGFTLVEVIVTMGIAVIILTAAAPAFSNLVEKQRLDGASGRLASDIQFARAEAARRGERVYLSVRGSQSGCWMLHTGSKTACTCTDDGVPTCNAGAEALKTVGMGGLSPVRVTGGVASIVFDPLHGTTSPTNTFTLAGRSGRSVRLVVNLMGQVRTCSPSIAAPAVPGYAVC